MAITTPNKHYFSAPSSNLGFMIDIVECLCGAHATIPSTTRWTVVDSWDGTTREVPAGGLLTNSTTKWAPGGAVPGGGSWIVLQSQPGRRAEVHQSKWLWDGSFTTVRLIPYADWVPGGGTGASPSIPSRTTPLSYLITSTGNTARDVVWDESMVAILSMNTTDSSQASLYLGELESRTTSVLDPRPFVHAEPSPSWSTGWQRYSPIDNTTLLTSGVTSVGNPSSAAFLLGTFLWPVDVYWPDTSHAHFAGTARHIAMGPQITVGVRTTYGLSLGVRDWAGFRASGNTSYIRHDGTTLTADAIRMQTSFDLDPPNTNAPTITFVTAGSIAKTDGFVVDITDDVAIADVSILINYTSQVDAAYTPAAFRGVYSASSTTSPITGGYRFTIYNSHENGWFDNFTVAVHAIDGAGNYTDSTSSSITVTSPLGYPSCISDPPVINFVTSGVIDSDDTITVDITDDTLLEDVVLTASYTGGTQVIYTALGFVGEYAGSSSSTPISGGRRFVIENSNGWYGDVTLHARAIDDAGSVTSDSESFTVSGGLGFPSMVVPGDDPVVTWITSAGSHAAASPIVVDVTDDTGCDDATVWVTYGAVKHIIHSRGEYAGLYSGSSASPISGGKRFTLVCDANWYEDMTIHVLAVDTYGNTSTSTRSWTVPDGAGAPPEVAPGSPPEVSFDGPSSIAGSGAVSISVTDDGEIGTVTIWAEFDGLAELIYTSEGFAGNYDGSSTVDVVSPTERTFTLISDSGWYDDMRVYALATDNAGQATTESRLYDVTGGPGVPAIPSGSNDTDRPEISDIEPSSITGIRALDPITFKITDNSGYVLITFITVEYADGSHELVYDGRFSPRYAASSSRVAVTNGYAYRLKRAGGWASSPKLWITVYDRFNNPIKQAIT